MSTYPPNIPLAKLRKEAKALAKARHNRDQLIDAAVTEGIPLRTVAEAAGVSHQTVANIVARHQGCES